MALGVLTLCRVRPRWSSERNANDDRRLIDQVDKSVDLLQLLARADVSVRVQVPDWTRARGSGANSTSGSGIVKFADGDSITSDNLGACFKLVRQ